MNQQFFIACKAIIVKDNKILLVRDSGLATDHAYNKGWWSPPGGRIASEEDIIHGLRREVQEEIGCEIEILDTQPIAKASWFFQNVSDEKCLVDGLFYECTISGNIKLDEEHDEYAWFGFDEIETLQVRAEIGGVITNYFHKKST